MENATHHRVRAGVAVPFNLVDEIELAEALGVSVNTLRAWRRKKIGVPFVKLNSAVRYDLEAVKRFIEANSVGVAEAAAR